MTKGEQVNYYRDVMLKTEREGIAELLDYMKDIGFLEAPASGGNHCCKEGGLLEHTTNVMQYAKEIGVATLGVERYNRIHNSLMIAAGLHDLGKCGREGKPYYVENLIKDGKPTKANPVQKYKRSEAKPYAQSKELLHIDHALRSVEIASRFIDLTEEEEHAIFYHDGMYGVLAYDLKGHEQPLQTILHFADYWAAQFVETDKLNNFLRAMTPQGEEKEGE